MHKVTFVAFASLAACAAPPSPAPVEQPVRHCRAANMSKFIGKIASQAVGAAILRQTQSSVLRWAPPGVMLTMDYRVDRVTVRFRQSREITAINCG